MFFEILLGATVVNRQEVRGQQAERRTKSISR
jgi:hypothetical protein